MLRTATLWGAIAIALSWLSLGAGAIVIETQIVKKREDKPIRVDNPPMDAPVWQLQAKREQAEQER